MNRPARPAVPPRDPQPAAAVESATSTADKQAAIDLARDFPLQSPSAKLPADPMEVFSPKLWSPSHTLQELYDRRSLMALGQVSLRTLERQGHAYRRRQEVQRSLKLWMQRAERFLDQSAPCSGRPHPRQRRLK